MKRIALIAVLLGLGARAEAQPARSEVAGETKEAAELEPDPDDPSAHFNFLNHWFDHGKYDEFGGPFGDGVMTDDKGHVVKNEKGEDEEEPMSPPFILLLVNFGILLIILGRWGAPAARKLAEDRHDQIKTALDDAAKLRDQAAKKLSEYETRIKDLDSEIKKLVDGIRADAEADKARILEAAKAQSAQMKRDADLRIAAEIELARAALTREVTAAAAAATEKLLREKTTAEDQTKLVASFISGMGRN